VPGTTSYRNVARFPDVEVCDGVRIVRIDAALSFVNAQHIKRLCLDHAAELTTGPRALVIDCSGINDIDATGADTLAEIVTELDATPVTLHLSEAKGPVRDVLHRSGLWARLDGRIHATNQQAVDHIEGRCRRPASARAAGIDEREPAGTVAALAADHDLPDVTPELERTVSP
jgi:SulP family sulfate permease